MKGKIVLLTGAAYLALTRVSGVFAQDDATGSSKTKLRIDQRDIGFQPPSLDTFLSFLIKFFFVLAGLLALFYMLWGALSWVTSGGDTEAVKKAREKIIAAAVGVILIVATLSIIVALEQIVFQGKICFGLSCDLTLPKLLECPDGTHECEEGTDREGACVDDASECNYSTSQQSGTVSSATGSAAGNSNTGSGRLPDTGL